MPLRQCICNMSLQCVSSLLMGALNDLACGKCVCINVQTVEWNNASSAPKSMQCTSAELQGKQPRSQRCSNTPKPADVTAVHK